MGCKRVAEQVYKWKIIIMLLFNITDMEVK